MLGTPRRSRFRPQGRRTGTHSTVAAAAAAATVLLVAGCGGGGDVPTGAVPEPDATYGGLLPAAQAPAPEGFSSQNIEGVVIDAPEGWEVDQGDGQLCMRPPGQSDCGYGAIQVRPKAAERDSANWPKKGDAFNKDDGWAADTSACRSPNTAAAGEVGIKEARHQVVGNGLTTHADGLKSHYSVWSVTCDNDETFEVRMWFLPTSDVLVYAWSIDQRYEPVYLQVAESMDVTEYNR
ncbi:hypothetical protein [Nocardiopsis ansamitocini]|uniref:Uncharacterized protein n=1 Tax=Nocardiopsis ansamitocini TaxID=1670832 RepID=A0A9W6UI50_9ACTN|nr:hypothetical protein [Nocardiopsis ansamitocini]GLU46685.1 hypothetical protein Nans01_10360 [Nocardiopsis ansamitocini]